MLSCGGSSVCAPGPTGVGPLLRYARRFGVTISDEVAPRHGLSLENPLRRAGADLFLGRLSAGWGAGLWTCALASLSLRRNRGWRDLMNSRIQTLDRGIASA